MRRMILGLGIVAAFGFTCPTAQAQQELDGGGRTALENARGGEVRRRSPGNMVQAGVAQAEMFGRGAAIGVDVTDTEEPPSIFAELLAESITFLFEQVNEAIDMFTNLLLLRAGESPDLSSLTGSLPTSSAADE